jgi:hypothetical protein
MSFLLPPQLTEGASLRVNEYGWPISAFPEALAKARSLGFACFGGQFQFRLPDSTCEMHSLKADPTDRRDHEPWSDFSNRSCSEVMSKFEDIISKTDFVKEAANWKLDARTVETLVFVAYFESEKTSAEIPTSDTGKRIL